MAKRRTRIHGESSPFYHVVLFWTELTALEMT